MVYCYDYLSYHKNFNSFLGLPFFVNRDVGRYKYKFLQWFGLFYQYFTEVMVITGTISCVLAVPLVWNDMNVLCGCLSSLTHSVQLSTKTLLLKFNKDQFLAHLKNFDKILKRNDDLRYGNEEINFQTFHQKASKYVRIGEAINFLLSLTSTTLYFSPFIYRSLANYDSINEQLLPIVGYIPFEYHTVPAFQLVVLYQTVCFYLFNLKTVVIDFFFLGMIVLHTTHLRYLNLILKKMVSKGDYSDERLMQWVRQYSDTLEELKNFKTLMAPHLLVEYGYILIHTCIPAFVITSTLSWSLNQKIALFVISTATLLVFYMLSSAGDALIASNDSIAWTFYGPHLFTKKSKFSQLAHKMLLYRVRIKPLAMSVSTLFPLCSSTYGHILRLVYTFYMALNEIQKIKN